MLKSLEVVILFIGRLEMRQYIHHYERSILGGDQRTRKVILIELHF